MKHRKPFQNKDTMKCINCDTKVIAIRMKDTANVKATMIRDIIQAMKAKIVESILFVSPYLKYNGLAQHCQ